MRSVRRPALVVAVALALTACGGEPGPASSGTPTTAAATSAAPGTTSSSSATTSATVSHGPAGNPTITPGTALPGEDVTQDQAEALQASIDEGHQPWRVHPDMVAEAYVRSRFGWEDLSVGMADPHTAEVTNRPDGQIVTLQLRQPVREGPRGIWVVTSGVYVGVP